MANTSVPLDLTRPGIYVGARVRELRAHRGLTREALAAASGVSAHALARLEEGHHADCTVSRLLRLSQALRVKPATLLPERLPVPRRPAAKETTHD